MSGLESGAVEVGQFCLSVIISKITTYINHINNCEYNLTKLLEKLDTLLAEKDFIDAEVLKGENNSGILTPIAVLWYERVRNLVNNESMKRLMNTDMSVAKVMLRLMKNDLKKLVKDDRNLRELVVKVMKDNTNLDKTDKQAGTSEVSNVDGNDKQAGTSEVSNVDGNDKRAGTSEVSNVDGNAKRAGTSEVSNMDEKDKQVREVLEKLMAETINEFKELMQNDEKMATAAMHLLESHKEKGKFKELTEMDTKVAEIIAKAKKMSNEEEIPSANHDDENGTTNNIVANVDTLKNKVKNMLKPVRNLILDEDVLKALPEKVRLGVEAMGVVIGNRKELKAELMDSDNINRHRNCGCCVISYNYFSDRYNMSVAAEDMRVTIEELSGSKPEIGNVTLPKPLGEMEPVPTDFVGLDSRNKLFGEIKKSLASNGVNAIGVFGMGGSGKTTLAIEVANSKANGIFDTAVMVEISESPNIESIQNQIGVGLGLDRLHEVHGIKEKARVLHDRLKSEGIKEDNKPKKILIVLDNIWKKIDLAQIGIIPHEYCKLLLTSREMGVCKAMIVNEDNIFEAVLLNEAEAKDLFRFQVKMKIHSGEYKSLADRLLEKCRGLPLAIVATANSLKGKDLPFWRQFAKELERPISCQISGVHYETFSILRTSYDAMASEEKKKFFLLACLSPIGSSISIDNLMRYGIGLDLFQHVNKLSEAIETARTWVEELVSSSMLLRGDSNDEYVKIHDVVRESTMSFASKSGLNTDGQMFLVDAIPRWICKETFDKYTGISLLSRSNYARLSGVKANLLQILLLKGKHKDVSLLDPNFFQGMANLKVLEVSFMNFDEGLPKSMRKLKDLKTLHLVECKLRDIKLIGQLRSLLVLSFRRSHLLEGLPDEIGNLSNLRLLDMSDCYECERPRQSANVITRLSLLEGLYLVDSSLTEWVVRENTYEETSVIDVGSMDELNKLKFLNVLEVMFSPTSLLFSPKFVKNLDKSQIYVGYAGFRPKPSAHSLTFSNFDVSQELEKDNGLNLLLKKVDVLYLDRATIKNIVPELDDEGFRDLGYLELQELPISRICEGKVPLELFSNLRHLGVSDMEELEELFPGNPVPQKLTTLYISICKSLAYIFSENGSSPPSNGDDRVNKESDIIKLPHLKVLQISKTSLKSVVKSANTDDSGHTSLFNNKVQLPSLEKLELREAGSFVNVCGKESRHIFQNLKVILIEKCHQIESIGPPSMFLSLVQLESLQVDHCKKMQQFISTECDRHEISKGIITFPKLKCLRLLYCLENLESFYSGSYKMKFPRLETVCIAGLHSQATFTGGSRALFREKMEFPSLVTLELSFLSNVIGEREDEGITSNPKLETLCMEPLVAPKLRNLAVSNTDHLQGLFSGEPNQVTELPSLEGVHISHCTAMTSLSTIPLKAPSLRGLNVRSCRKMEWFFVGNTNFGTNPELTLPSLEYLCVEDCPNIKSFSPAVLKAPKLKELDYVYGDDIYEKCTIPKSEDINQYLQIAVAAPAAAAAAAGSDSDSE